MVKRITLHIKCIARRKGNFKFYLAGIMREFIPKFPKFLRTSTLKSNQ